VFSFQIPSKMVKKVWSSIKKCGDGQRALLNVSIADVDAEIAKKYDIDKIEGVFIGKVQPGGAAEAAGIKDKDVIISVDNIAVNSTAELQEQISKHRPGDKVSVEIKRDNKKKLYNVTLRNKNGDMEIVKGDDSDNIFGAKFDAVSDREKEELEIPYGVKITELNNGKFKDAGIKKGFIITQVNKNPISEVNDLKRIINN